LEAEPGIERERVADEGHGCGEGQVRLVDVACRDQIEHA
jgi:hypothetical protein